MHRHVPRCTPSVYVGLTGLWVLAFFGPQGHVGIASGLLMLIGASIPHWRALCRSLSRDPVFHAFILLATYVGLRATFAADAPFSTSSDQALTAAAFAIPGPAAVLVAWWLQGRAGRSAMLIAGTVLGLCIELVVELDSTDLKNILAGERAQILSAYLTAALYSGIALLALIVGAARLNQISEQFSFPVKNVLRVTAMVAILLLLAALVITESRAVWGMLVVLAPLALFIQYRLNSTRPGYPSHRRNAKMALVVAAVFVTAAIAGGERVTERLTEESNVIARIMEGDWENIPKSSIGVRVHLNALGISALSEKPWFGWGPGTDTTPDLLARFNANDLDFFHHLHNTYLEIGVRLGLIGVILYSIAIFLLIRSSVQSVRNGRMPIDFAIFLSVSGLLILGWAMIDYRLGHSDFWFWLVILFAVAHTFSHPQDKEIEPVETLDNIAVDSKTAERGNGGGPASMTPMT